MYSSHISRRVRRCNWTISIISSLSGAIERFSGFETCSTDYAPARRSGSMALATLGPHCTDIFQATRIREDNDVLEFSRCPPTIWSQWSPNNPGCTGLYIYAYNRPATPERTIGRIYSILLLASRPVDSAVYTRIYRRSFRFKRIQHITCIYNGKSK